MRYFRTKLIISSVTMHAGHICDIDSWLDIRPGVHGCWSLHDAGISSTEVWRTTDPRLSRSVGPDSLRLH